MYRNRNNKRASQAPAQSEYTHDHTLCGHDHDHSLQQELLCHVPLSVISLTIGFILVAIIKAIVSINDDSLDAYNDLFHMCHYAHLLFAASGTAATFFRFAPTSYLFGTILAMSVPFIFCTLSDIVLPTLGAQALGIPIAMHLCFLHMHDLFNVAIFLLCGAVTGICLTKGSKQTMRQYAGYMHFLHIFVSALAALFYMTMNGIDDLVGMGGILLLMLLVSVALPCTLSDCFVPFTLGRWYAKRIRTHHRIEDTGADK